MPATLSKFSMGPLVKRIPAFLILFLTSCYKDYLYVQQQTIDESYLASNHVSTPDPKKEFPFQKQRLLIYWDFPKSLFEKKLILNANILLWNLEKKIVTAPIQRKRDFLTIDLSSEDPNLKLLTYQIQVQSENGDCISTWNHQFWTNLITIED